MTYDAALNLFMVVAIPAVVLVSYKLYSMSRKRQGSSAMSQFAYEVDEKSGEIIFADEKDVVIQELASDILELESGQDELDITMMDVLDPLDEEPSQASDRVKAKAYFEEVET